MCSVLADVTSVKVVKLEVFVVDVILKSCFGDALRLATWLKGTLVFPSEIVYSS